MLNTFLEKTAAVDVKRSPSSSLLDMMWFYNLVTFSRHRRRDSFHRTIKDCNVFLGFCSSTWLTSFDEFLEMFSKEEKNCKIFQPY